MQMLEAMTSKCVASPGPCHLKQYVGASGQGVARNFLAAPVKGKARCMDKVTNKYSCAGQGGCRQLTDVVRGSIVFVDEPSMCTFIDAVLKDDLSSTPGGAGVLALDGMPQGVKVAVRYSKNRFARICDGTRLSHDNSSAN